MTIFAWSDSLSVNHKEIDQQHMRLVELLADLERAHAAGEGKDMLARVIRELNDYVREHFSTEERLMQHIGFPGLEAHMAQHEAFVEKLLHFELDYLGDRAELSQELLAFLKRWFEEHVTGFDQEYARHFEQHGLL
ncbi:MAG: bacteriohemerythrin [Acidobacteriota bacterium]